MNLSKTQTWHHPNREIGSIGFCQLLEFHLSHHNVLINDPGLVWGCFLQTELTHSSYHTFRHSLHPIFGGSGFAVVPPPYPHPVVVAQPHSGTSGKGGGWGSDHPNPPLPFPRDPPPDLYTSIFFCNN